MNPARRAVIDVGTNSVKLLVADVRGTDVQPVLEDSAQTRLGQGFYETHLLQPEAIAQTARAVKAFAAQAHELHAQAIRVIATSAARDAKNSYDLTNAIAAASGLPTQIISGDQEAEWAFAGVTSDARFAASPLLLLDVGGGSTEFILGHEREIHFRRSFPLGTVRLLEKFPLSDPPTAAQLAASRAWLAEFFRAEILPALAPAMQRETKLDPRHRQIRLVGTGGTATILARMAAGLADFDRDRIESARLTLAAVRDRTAQLWSLPLAERATLPGLPRKRADVILPGVLIFEAVLAELGLDELAVSTRGLRFAVVSEAA
jgi:exopolyphosphatase/guanosine-5'-triphosphate,3'-diphosphate pyrophosphatase